MATVTKETVNEAIQQLQAENKNITNKAIREIIGSGSYTTIGSIVTELGVKRKSTTTSIELPTATEKKLDEFKQILAKDLASLLEQEQQNYLQELANINADYQSVLQENNTQVKQIEKLNKQLADVIREKNSLVGELKQLTNNLQQIKLTQAESIDLLKEQLNAQIKRNDELQNLLLKNADKKNKTK